MHVDDAAVELPFVVLEDPQARDLAGEPLGDCLVVVGRDAEEHAEPAPDLGHGLAADEHLRDADPLDDGAHPRKR